MIIVTGGCGFIGANLIHKLNRFGIFDIIIVDKVNKHKAPYLKKIKFTDLIEKNSFLKKIEKSYSNFNKAESIFHLGACTNTLEDNWDYLKYNNLYHSKKIYEFSKYNSIKFIYASSASVYGLKSGYQRETDWNLKPLNLYAKSKYEFDKFLFKNKKKTNAIGLRFFNVYGAMEDHKKNMSSPVQKFYQQTNNSGICKVFQKFKNYEINDYQRDFIYVEDCVKILIQLSKKNLSGIYNLGTGKTTSFYKIADYLIKKINKGKIKLIPFPKKLIEKYQFVTKANITSLRNAGIKMNNLNDYKSGIDKFLKIKKNFF